jgi:signal transduction histidine kinase
MYFVTNGSQSEAVDKSIISDILEYLSFRIGKEQTKRVISLANIDIRKVKFSYIEMSSLLNIIVSLSNYASLCYDIGAYSGRRRAFSSIRKITPSDISVFLYSFFAIKTRSEYGKRSIIFEIKNSDIPDNILIFIKGFIFGILNTIKGITKIRVRFKNFTTRIPLEIEKIPFFSVKNKRVFFFDKKIGRFLSKDIILAMDNFHIYGLYFTKGDIIGGNRNIIQVVWTVPKKRTRFFYTFLFFFGLLFPFIPNIPLPYYLKVSSPILWIYLWTIILLRKRYNEIILSLKEEVFKSKQNLNMTTEELYEAYINFENLNTLLNKFKDFYIEISKRESVAEIVKYVEDDIKQFFKTYDVYIFLYDKERDEFSFYEKGIKKHPLYDLENLHKVKEFKSFYASKEYLYVPLLSSKREFLGCIRINTNLLSKGIEMTSGFIEYYMLYTASSLEKHRIIEKLMEYELTQEFFLGVKSSIEKLVRMINIIKQNLVELKTYKKIRVSDLNNTLQNIEELENIFFTLNIVLKGKLEELNVVEVTPYDLQNALEVQYFVFIMQKEFIMKPVKVISDSYVYIDATVFGNVIREVVSNAVDSLPDEGGEIEIIAYETVALRYEILQKYDLFDVFDEYMSKSKSEKVDFMEMIRNTKPLLDDELEDIRANMKKYLTISVKDNGSGIDDKIKGKIFTPFFTTKGGEHMGIGLSFAKIAIEAFGGSIYVSSQKGKGTTIEINVPIDEPYLKFLCLENRIRTEFTSILHIVDIK